MSAIERTRQAELVVEEDLTKYLCFLLNNKSYAINISCVKEIMEHTEVTPIPMMPEFFRGAINLRGSGVPVLDISIRLGMGASQISKRSCIVIVEVEVNEERLDVGVMVDAVSEVTEILSSNIEKVPSFGGHLQTDFMHGMGKVNEKFVIILNVDRIFSMEDLEKLSEVSSMSIM